MILTLLDIHYKEAKPVVKIYKEYVDSAMTFLAMSQEGWCDSVGSVEQIQTKLLKRQEAAAKRERAMAYALAHQVSN